MLCLAYLQASTAPPGVLINQSVSILELLKVRHSAMQLLKNLQRQTPQLGIPRALQMSLEPPLSDAPVPTPDDKTHLLYTDFAEKSLAVRVEVGRCCEEAVGFDAAVEELA